jgi:hypothetical protein
MCAHFYIYIYIYIHIYKYICTYVHSLLSNLQKCHDVTHLKSIMLIKFKILFVIESVRMREIQRERERIKRMSSGKVLKYIIS